MPSVRRLLPAALLALTACVGLERLPESSDGVSSAGFVAPDDWAFPAANVVAVHGMGGMVSSTDRVASEIGVEALRRGGNAVDAAIATHFALAVVNPEAGNIGGGGFMLVRLADGRTGALDFRETAPARATRDMYLDANGDPTEHSRVGPLSAGVPGSVAGMWEAHRRFGSLPWPDLVQPAINVAQGLVVHERLARSLRTYEERLRRYDATASALLIDGRAPRVGDRLTQSDLAETLQRIAREGRDGFYRGETATLVEAEMRRGGIITREDLAGYEAVWREPVVFGYRQHTVLSMPPSSSGGATLAEILNILEGQDLATAGFLSRDHVHQWAEAVKRAFVDRNAYLADPAFVAQPIDEMASEEYAARRRAEISSDRATPHDQIRAGIARPPAVLPGAPGRESADTTHYSIVDGAGNAVAVTTTLNSLYGSQVTVSGAGFLLNNEMDDFAVAPGLPNQFGLVQGEANAIEPGKRMLSSMTPTILLAPAGRVKLVTGTPGGPTIITTIAQVLSNMVDFRMDVAGATAAPRLHHQHVPDVLYYERDGLGADVASALGSSGHVVEARAGYQGETQSIAVLPDGTLVGVADPRGGGAAVGVRIVREVVR